MGSRPQRHEAGAGSTRPVDLRSRLRRRLKAWLAWFVTDEVRALGPTLTARANVLVLVTPVVLLATVAPALSEALDGRPTPLTPVLAISLCSIFALTPFWLRWTGSPNIAGAWMLLSAVVASCIPAYFQQGIDSILMVWFLVIPSVASFLLGARWTLVFSAISTLCISGFWLLHALPEGFREQNRLVETSAFRWLNLLLALGAVSAVVVFWELSAKRAEREREALEIQIRRSQKLETVALLAGGIAHDFNNILAAILGHASLLERETGGAAQRRVRAIVDSSQRAAVLVEQMLAYAGRGHSRVGTVELPALVHDVAELLGPALGKAELVFDLDPDTPALVADPVQIQQVVMNLITNAAESLEGKRGRVWIRSGTLDSQAREVGFLGLEHAGAVLLEVRDEGCGIAAEQLEAIFDPFFTTKPHGHGLGLAAVLGIVRTHGGDVRVDSELGRGTRFRVLLPRPSPEDLARAQRHDDAPKPRLRLSSRPRSDLGAVELPESDPPPPAAPAAEPRGFVLIVDDEDMVRELAGEVLERAGHRVLLARDGDHGLRVFESHRDDIALLVFDRSMPGRDGIELLAEVRGQRPDLPAILSSGYADDANSPELRAAGFDAILHKPWAPNDLVSLVSELARRAR